MEQPVLPSVGPVVQPAIHRPLRRRAHLHFSTTEIVSILISMATIVLAFNMFGISDQGIIFGLVLGIIGHELAHKFIAQSLGLESRYKLWEIGLVLVVAFAIITRGRFIFAAPGFVVTDGTVDSRERGLISLSAPTANIILALFFILAGGVWAMSAAYINILLAIFNLLPVGPLDGAQVMEWSPAVWTCSFVFACLLGMMLVV